MPPLWVTVALMAAAAAVVWGVISRVRASLAASLRLRNIRTACGELVPRQGGIFVMVHHRNRAAACARLFAALRDTAACPQRIAVGVYQELALSEEPDVSCLVAGAGNNLRVISTALPTEATFAVHELMERCWRSERTVVLMAVDTVPAPDWDRTLLDELAEAEAEPPGRRVVCGGPQAVSADTLPGFPTWATTPDGVPFVVPRPFGTPLDDAEGYLGTNGYHAPSVAASTALCVARATTWRRMRPVSHPVPDLSLSAALARCGARFRVLRRPHVYGGSPDPYQPAGPLGDTVDSASRAALRRFGTRYGLRTSPDGGCVVAIGGRCRMGLTGSARPSGREVMQKYGTRADFDRHRGHFA